MEGLSEEDFLLACWGTWLLVFARMVGFFVQAPIWGSHHTPKTILAGCATMLSFLMYPYVTMPQVFTEGGFNLVGLAAMIAQQFAVGLVMGYLSFLTMVVAQFGGELLDMQMGLSTAASYDPAQHGASNMIRRTTFYCSMLIYLMCDGHIKTLDAMRRSFEVIPLDGFAMSKPLLDMLWKETGNVFVLALELAAPVVAAILICQISLGMVARAAPQMNVFMLSFPVNIAVGMTLLTASWPYMEQKFYRMYERDYELMFRAMKLMKDAIVVGGGG